MKTSTPPGPTSSAVDLAQRFCDVRAATRALAAPLSPEDCVVQSMTEASPVKWHLAHTTWFFETFVLNAADPGRTPFDRDFGFLFNSYYESVGERVARTKRGLLTRPTLERVLEYRRRIDDELGELLDARRLTPGLDAVVELGLHHEQQHQELILTDLKHHFAQNPLLPAYRAGATREAAVAQPLRWTRFDEGLTWLGHAGDGFAFDNEGPRHRAFLESFELASRPVTNAEYLAFVEDGGYRRAELWLSDGWDAVQRLGWNAPLYWERCDGAWRVFTLAGQRALEPAEPVVHVGYYEADAFARWAGARLPREGEWERAAAGRPVRGNFVEHGALHPVASGTGEDGAPAALFGDVWEWTQSPYVGYPGYRAVEGALGEYNGKFMCNQLVLRGGSCASPASHLRATYRNFFGPEARWQFSGLRLARDA
jgi:ergothioneine biosynthesis protein EgtB